MLNKFSLILFCLLTSSLAAAVATPLIASIEPTVINEAAKESTVRVNGQNPGSGVIYKKEGNQYYVLTAKHVVETPDEYEIITDDEQVYPLDYAKVFPIPDTDLAIAEFTSDQDYQSAELGDSDRITEGDDVFIAGWPQAGEAIPYIYQFITGNISGLPPRLLPGGYGLIYTSTARQGMSGGPVFNNDGAVVGIHGRAEGKEIYLPESDFDSTTVRDGFSLGVPINVFLDKTLDPSADAESGPPVTSVEPSVEPEVPPAVRERVISRRSDADRFEQPLVLARQVEIPTHWQFRESEYLFTVDIPAAAGAPLQQIVFHQIEGAGYPSFSIRETHAFETGSSSVDLPLSLVSNDTGEKTMTVVFDPPVEPGRQITVALKANRNPRDGTYLFELQAYPPGIDSQRQRLGTRTLRFYEPVRRGN